jgi:hypothetical protein
MDEREVNWSVLPRRAAIEMCAVVVGLLIYILFGSIVINRAKVVRVFVLDAIEFVSLSSFDPHGRVVHAKFTGRLTVDFTWSGTFRRENELKEEFYDLCSATTARKDKLTQAMNQADGIFTKKMRRAERSCHRPDGPRKFSTASAILLNHNKVRIFSCSRPESRSKTDQKNPISSTI